MKLSHPISKVVIYLNFPEDGHLGCRMKCHFCDWYHADYNERLCLSDEELTELISDNPSINACQLSGGGDPLFHFDKNKDDVIRILTFFKQRGMKTEILTHEYDEVATHWDKELNGLVDAYSFSTEAMSQSVKDLIDTLSSAGIHVRMTKILNFGASINWDYIDRYMEFYTKDNPSLHITLRSNFTDKLPEDDIQAVHEEVYRRYGKYNMNFHGSKIGMTALVGNKAVIKCHETSDYINAWLKNK